WPARLGRDRSRGRAPYAGHNNRSPHSPEPQPRPMTSRQRRPTTCHSVCLPPFLNAGWATA
ncbi:hypothetical protein, partial [uncultured Desulfovibrio sp.]|uniref:hypothetical protein n=1 Tax=uncultured Desulfovibrio sp. TaxID=167968 RepID=UPI002599C8E9